jgi:hypothetical protein
MTDEKDINERLGDIERDLRWIIQYLLKRDQPIQPPPYIPSDRTKPTLTWPNTVMCSRCGMNFSGSMGYVCTDKNCPTQMNITY